MSRNAHLALTALLLLVPAPSIGAWMAFHGAPGPVGQAAYVVAKAWILALPLLWLLRVEKGRPGLSPLAPELRRAGIVTGLAFGLLLSGAVLLVWHLRGAEWIDRDRLRNALVAAGVTTPLRYAALGVYLCTLNAAGEEYVWRWFVTARCETLLGPRPAVAASALFFAAHHAIVFMAQFGTKVGLLAALAVFLAGGAWSWCYLRFRSVWPGWISHAMVDVTGLALGWHLLFGP